MDISPDQIHQIAFEEGQPADTGDGYLFTAEEFDLFVDRLLTTATPVPPAGDVEVRAHIVRSLRGRAILGFGANRNGINLVDVAHVTRLTAERDAMGSKVESMRRKNNELNDTEARLTAELTKARELLKEIRRSCELSKLRDGQIDALLAHQSAPAAKGGLCKRCAGYGTVSTGIDECPTTICDPCDGTEKVKP